MELTTIMDAVDDLLAHPDERAPRLRNADIFIGLFKYVNQHWPEEAQWRYHLTAYWWGEKPVLEEHKFPHMEAVFQFMQTGVTDKEAHNG